MPEHRPSPRSIQPFLPLALLALLAPLAAQTQWVQRTTAVRPPSRNSTAMVFDAARGHCVLFAGFGGGVLADTWTWDGTAWTQRSPATSPPARNGHAMAYDSRRGRTVLFGGAVVSSTSYADTWEWDGTNWTQATPATSPPARVNHYLCFDSVRGRVLLFGGHTNYSSQGVNLADTWEWDGTNWTQATPAASPSARPYHAMAFDGARGRAVLFGGGTASQPLNDTWEWDGTNWLQRNPAAKPSARADTELVFDAARGRVVLFGGFPSLSDTWEWDGTNWLQRNPPARPSGRYAYGFAHDSVRGVDVLFGGYSGGQVGDTWEYASASPATYVGYGAGCPGSSGTPALAAAPGSLPWLGDNFGAALAQGRPSSVAILFTGFSRTTWQGIPLPFDLGPVGAPLCKLLAPGTILLAGPTDGQGAATLGLQVPNDGSLVGGMFYQQCAVLDAAANALGFSFSNGGEGSIGAR